MPKSLKYLIPVCSLFTLAGCAALAGLLPSGGGSNTSATASGGAAATAPATSMFDEVELSSQLQVIAPSAFLEETGWLDQQIVAEQCKYATPDPPFMVPTTDAQKGWSFIGRLNEKKDGQTQEMQALEYRSFWGFGWPKQQLNSWPVSVVTLSQMPKEYLSERLEMINNSKLSQDQIDQLGKQYIANAGEIDDRVKRLESTYNPDTECSSH